MEINLHLRNTEPPGKVIVTKPVSPPPVDPTEGEVALENTRALKTALDHTPIVRADVVERATEMLGDVNYPPPETIRMISNLLAIKFQQENEQS